MTCPICAREADDKYKPFCSRRCADIDLGKWLNGSYAIPAAVTDQDDDDGHEGNLGEDKSFRQ